MDLDNLQPKPENHEAAMARADLYKLANYSMKLFKMIQEGQELEGWVQAKITKAADYIASVYHFMEYEMKVSEYGETLENAEMYSESVRRAFEQKLFEAKAKMKEMSKKNAKDVKMDEAAKPDFLDMDKDGDKKEPMKKAVADKKKSAVAKDVKEAEEKRAPAKKQEREVTLPSGAKTKATKVQGWQSQKADKAADKDLDESKDEKRAPAKKTERETTLPSGAKVKTTKVQGWQSQKADKAADKERNVDESTGDYSAVKARAGKDIGKPGKQFAKIAKSAGERYGSKERGEKVAGAVLAKLRSK